MKVDYLIVGQGLAGSALFWQLNQRGKSVMVYDMPHENDSSLMAAGLFNPVTGRKMVKTWKADALFPYLIPFYREIEKATGTSFLHEKAIYRPFQGVEEQNDWEGKQADPAFAPFIKKVVMRPMEEEILENPFGGLLLKMSGYLDTATYLEATRAYLQSKEAFRAEHFREEQVEVVAEGVQYHDIEAKYLLLCQGRHVQQYFEWLPFRPVKGEWIRIEADQRLSENFIPNRGVFMIPGAGNAFKVGATYDHQLTTEPTEKALLQLKEKLSGLFKRPYEIVEQKVGFRPATKDRRPFVGVHPKHDRIATLNGLGAKGVSLAPYFAQQLVEHLENGAPLLPEVDINRYISLY